MRLIKLLILAVFPFFANADAWDNLTMDEAQQVVSFLKDNPFIFDYCDCCDNEGEFASEVHMFKVTSTEIVKCDWDEEKFSVKIEFDVIAQIIYLESGPDLSRMFKPSSDEYDNIVFMNYTWGYNAETRMARPLFASISYTTYAESTEGCKAAFSFPSPSMLRHVGIPGGYKKWYKKNVL